MKRILLLLFGALLLSLPSFARDFTYTYDGQTLTYTVLNESAKICQTKAGSGLTGAAGNNISGTLTIPEKASDGENSYSVIAIGEHSFYSNYKLTSVTIPNSVAEIGDLAFYDCENLKTLYFNAVNCTQCGSLEGYTAYPVFPKNLENIYIGDEVTNIPDLAFFGSSIETIKIPDSVKTIGQYAFYDCSGLTSATIGESVETIKEQAFSNCSNLKKLYFNAISCSKFGKIDGAFVYTVFPETLNHVEFGDKVTIIPQFICLSCSELMSINIPNSVTEIGWAAFGECTSLTTVTIPSSVTSIGSDAFNYCYALESVYYEATEPIEAVSDVFATTTYSNARLYVPAEAVQKCKQIDPWKNFANIEAHDFTGVEAIADDGVVGDEPCEVYNLNGVMVGTSTENLRPGLYIVRQGGKTSKIVVK